MSINQINDGDSGLTVRTILNEMVSFINSDTNYIGTGSFAKTGSNTFIGNQTITGSVNITGSLTVNTVNVGQNTLNFIDNSGNIINSLSISGSNLVLSTGSISTTSGGLTGSLFGTSSWANNAITASFLPTGTYNITASWSNNSVSSSFTTTANTASNVFSTNVSNATNYSIVLTATGTTGVKALANTTAATIGIVPSVGRITATSVTASLFGTASYALTASHYSNNILTLTPQDPLPSGVPTGSFAVSSSIPPRPYMWDGSSWYAL